jgi:transcriptional regulator with AAA-type ATPase domain
MMDLFLKYKWPRNIGELSSTIQRGVYALSQISFEASHRPLKIVSTGNNYNTKRIVCVEWSVSLIVFADNAKALYLYKRGG